MPLVSSTRKTSRMNFAQISLWGLTAGAGLGHSRVMAQGSRWRHVTPQHEVLLRALQADQNWRTLHELSAVTGIRETSLSAQLRNLRKQEYGAHTVAKRRLNGEWGYRIYE